MITNATLNTILPLAPSNPDGSPAFGTAVALGCRCNLGDVTSGQRYTIGQAVQDATAVLYAPKAPLRAASVVPASGGRVMATVDGGASAIMYRIVHVRDRQKSGGLEHYEVFLML